MRRALASRAVVGFSAGKLVWDRFSAGDKWRKLVFLFNIRYLIACKSVSWSVFERLVIILVSVSSTSELEIEDLTLSLDEGEARTDRTIDQEAAMGLWVNRQPGIEELPQ